MHGSDRSLVRLAGVRRPGNRVSVRGDGRSNATVKVVDDVDTTLAAGHDPVLVSSTAEITAVAPSRPIQQGDHAPCQPSCGPPGCLGQWPQWPAGMTADTPFSL